MDDATLYDLFGSLSREIATLRTEVRDGVQRIEARLARQGGVINDLKIEDLSRRLEKLEGKS